MSSYARGQLSPDGSYRWDGTAWTPAAPNQPAPPPAWLSLRLSARASWLSLAGCVIVGLLADQFLRLGTIGLAATAMLVVAAAALVIARPIKRAQPLALAAVAVILAGFLTLRASPWLIWPDLLTATGLLAIAASIATSGSVFDIGIPEIAGRAFHALAHFATGIAYIARPAIDARGRVSGLGPLARGVAIAAPIAVLLCALLASADPVFASFLALNIDPGRLVLDVLFFAFGVIAMAGLLRLAAAEPLDRIDGPRWRLGSTETLVVLGVLDAIFAAFAFAQALAASGAAAGTLRAAGVTYSDYARNGFFQLLWVAGITLVVLVALSRISRVSARGFQLLALAAIALTLLIVFVAFRRLSLYEEAYGFTMLRLYSHIFAAWVAVVFLLLAAELLGTARNRRWFAGAVAASALAVVMALNVANPEALVVSLNVDHARSTHKIDSAYLAGLSSDATPAMVSALMDPAVRAQVRRAACAGPKSYAPEPVAFNLADLQAAAARRAHC